MNVFEDLIVELKEENLLEETVVGVNQKKKNTTELSDSSNAPNADAGSTEFSAYDEEMSETDRALLGSNSAEISDANVEVAETVEVTPSPEAAKPAKPKRNRHGKEFFNKRAVDEVSSHQMVEHILTGVEREYMKIVPKAFDDFNAKKALNNFLNISENSNSEEHKAAEFALMQETEAWGLSLIQRDSHISVAHIRQYCENSRPALSSQAMLALAKFYRNAPYSESVRSKFDFVITRLFSRPISQDKRLCLFGKEEMLSHINSLYSDWSSVPLYDAEHDESKIMLTGLSFDELASEAEGATHFDQLIESDFFGRLRLFKESINELFYEPSVIAAAIESNVRIGNAYVDLIVSERRKMDAASIQTKYSDFNDPAISDAAGRSLDLVELLRNLTDEDIGEEPIVEELEDEVGVETETIEKAAEAKPRTSAFVGRTIEGILDINRWLLGTGLVLILISGSLYVWASFFMVEETVTTAGVTTVELDSTLAEHIISGKISGDTFYARLQTSWDGLTKEKREEYLQRVLQIGATKGYKQVDLSTKDGKAAGYASATRLEIYMP